jgi:hypothetical protein
MFGTTRNPLGFMRELKNPDVLLHYVTIVCFYYWMIARRLVLKYTGTSLAQPEYIWLVYPEHLHYDPKVFLVNFCTTIAVCRFYKTNNHGQIHTMRPRKEMAASMNSCFVPCFTTNWTRCFLYHKTDLDKQELPPQDLVKFAEFNVAKQPNIFWMTRYFTENGIANMKQYLQLDRDPIMRSSQSRFLRNSRYLRVQVDSKGIDPSHMPPTILSHRILNPTQPILDVTRFQTDLETHFKSGVRGSLPLAAAMHLGSSLGPFLPKTDFGNFVRVTLNMKPKVFNTSEGLDSPQAAYLIHLGDNSTTVGSARSYISRVPHALVFF